VIVTRDVVTFLSALLFALAQLSCESADESDLRLDPEVADASTGDTGNDGDSDGVDSGVVRPECTEPDQCLQLAEFERINTGRILLTHHDAEGMTVLGAAGFERYVFEGDQAVLRDVLDAGLTPSWAVSLDDLAVVFGEGDDEQARLMVFDLSDHWPPERIAQTEDPGLAGVDPVCAFAHYIVLSTEEELKLLDLSSPGTPRLAASAPRPEDRSIACTGNADAMSFVLAEADFDADTPAFTLEYGRIGLSTFPNGLISSAQIDVLAGAYLSGMQMASLDEEVYLAMNTYMLESGEPSASVWSLDSATGAIGAQVLEGASVSLWQSFDAVVASKPGEARLVAAVDADSWVASWPEADGAAVDVRRDAERVRVVLPLKVFEFEATGATARQTMVADLHRDETATNLDVVVVGSVAWVARGGAGVVGLELCAASAPWKIASLLGYPTDRIIGSEHWLVAIDASAGTLHVYDVSDPSQPTEIAVLQEDLTRVALDGSILVIMDGAELAVFDLQSDEPSRAVGAIRLWGPEREDVGAERLMDRGIDLHEGSALVAYDPHFFEVDVSDPARPVLISETYAEIGSGQVMVTDRYFGIDLAFYDRATFFDGEQFDGPLETFRIPDTSGPADEVEGIVYVADQESGDLGIYDVRGDELSTVATVLGTGRDPWQLSASGGRVTILDRCESEVFVFETVCR
jgi:hypothetical protein